MRTLATTLFLSSVAGLLGGPVFADATPAAPAPTTPARAAPSPAPAAPTPTWAPRSATPAVNLPPIDIAALPESCRTIAKQASAVSLQTALSARVSLASCLADINLAPLALLDCQDSVLAVEAATAPSFELLDGVIAAGDLTAKLIAEHAKGELYTSMAIRMKSTIPAASDAASIALHDSRVSILDTLLAPWRDSANAAFEHVVAIAKANPELVKNPVVKTAVAASQQRIAAKVATSS